MLHGQGFGMKSALYHDTHWGDQQHVAHSVVEHRGCGEQWLCGHLYPGWPSRNWKSCSDPTLCGTPELEVFLGSKGRGGCHVCKHAQLHETLQASSHGRRGAQQAAQCLGIFMSMVMCCQAEHQPHLFKGRATSFQLWQAQVAYKTKEIELSSLLWAEGGIFPLQCPYIKDAVPWGCRMKRD